MNQYLVIKVNANTASSFYHLLRVEETNDLKYFYVRESIMSSNGIRYKTLGETVLFERERGETLLEFPSDEAALLWFKLNY